MSLIKPIKNSAKEPAVEFFITPFIILYQCVVVLVNHIHYMARWTFNTPIDFKLVGPEEGENVGPTLESQQYPSVSCVTEQSLYFVRGALTCHVLLDGLKANAFREIGTDSLGGMTTATFQPVWLENK